ncbi:MAG: META domain-containing protein [Planctomycetes bacterium]|nr:META domain-containing protein [Planctomycetota bacterium]
MQPTLALLVVPLIVVACTAQGSAPGPVGAAPGPSEAPAPSGLALTGVEWRLVDVGGSPVAPAVGTRAAFLRFDAEESMLHGHGGVNSFFGPYAADGAGLRVETLALTRMAGPPELMEQERAFTAALHAVRAIRLGGGELVLLDGTGVELARLRAVEAQP